MEFNKSKGCSFYMFKANLVKRLFGWLIFLIFHFYLLNYTGLGGGTNIKVAGK